MNRIEVRPTSRYTAECEPITLRTDKNDTRRLVFKPVLVKNASHPDASIDGDLVYEKKDAKGNWQELSEERLTSLKSGEGVRFFLHADELLTLYRKLNALYELHQQQGIPLKRKTYVPVESEVANFLAIGEPELGRFLDTHKQDAANTLLKLMGWLAQSPEGPDAARRLISVAPTRVAEMTTLLGVAAMKDTVAFFRQHRSESQEEFWQKELSKRSYIFHQVFSYPIVPIQEKAYVGGKQLDNRGGYIADYLGKIESTNAVIIIEIKTPKTPLLGGAYRQGVYPISQHVSGAITQVLRYRQSLMQEFHTLRGVDNRNLTAAEPQCLVIAGNSAELDNDTKKDSFELQRQRVHGVTVVTYDELFKRIQGLVSLLERGDSGSLQPCV